MGQQSNKPETFSNVTPIGQQETFSNVTPIDGKQPAASAVQPSNPSTVPNARIRNMPDPSDPNAGWWNLYEGAKIGALGASPLFMAATPLPALARGLIGATIGGYGAKKATQLVGGGDRAQEVAGDVGSLVGGGLATRGPNTQELVTAPVRAGARTVEGLANSKLKGAFNLFNPADEAASTPVKIPGRDFGLKGPTVPPAEPTPAPLPPEQRLPAAFQPLPPKAPPVLGTVDNPFRGPLPGQAGSIAASMAKPPESAPTPPFQRGQLSKLLDEQLSKATNAAPPLNPKEPIYKRGAIAQAVKSSPSEDLTPVLQKSLDQVNAAKDIPEGHTPLTSSAMKSYKYDPAAREFHARMTSGDTTYVYGDVSPEDAQAFEAAESKGKALPQIKRNPLVAKIVNGKRVAVKPTQ